MWRCVAFYSSTAAARNVKKTVRHLGRTQQADPALRRQPPLPSDVQQNVTMSLRPVSLMPKNNHFHATLTNDDRKLWPIKAFSTADTFNFMTLLPYLQKRFRLMPYVSENCYHVILDPPTSNVMHHSNLALDELATNNAAETSTESASIPPPGEAFYFRQGTVVFWNTPDETMQRLVRELEQHAIDLYDDPDCEELAFMQRTDLAQSGMEGETIVLGGGSPDEMQLDKLAFSYGLAHGAKIVVFERQLERHLQSIRHIPTMLLVGRRLPLSRAEVLKKMGELLMLRGQLNLHTDLTDEPDDFWNEPRLGDLYTKVSRTLDLRVRAKSINLKLDYANELAAVLRNHLSEKHSLMLEWLIIALIAVEVMFNFLHMAERYGYVEVPNEEKKTK